MSRLWLPSAAALCVLSGLLVARGDAAVGVGPRRSLEVEEVLWGFDGQGEAQRFNLVSVQVNNATATPFDGALRLVQSAGGAPVGAPLEQEVYVAPYSRRWVQFHPFVRTGGEEWVLTWDRERYELPSAPLRKAAEADRPTAVLLTDPQELAGGGTSLKRLPENLFPPQVTATDGLDVVVLDHAPRWEEARQRAFLDWLSRGGTVHLLLGADGRHPEFGGVLAALDTPVDRFHVGAGLVVRHLLARGEADEGFVEQVVVPETAQRVRGPREETDEAEREAQRGTQLYETGDAAWVDDFTLGAFLDLKLLTLPRHRWPLIYLLTLVYVLALFPGCLLVGRLRARTPVAYGVLVGTIALFSVSFALLGRRGYGEQAAVNTVAIARGLPEGRWDVAGWTNVFATGGGRYTLEHEGGGRLYSTAQENERVNGVIREGGEGRFEVDVPPFSSRTLAWRAAIAAPTLRLRVEEWDAGPNALRSLVLAADAMPSGARAFALHGRQIRGLTLDSGRLATRDGGGQPLEAFLGRMTGEEFWHYSFADVRGEEAGEESEPWPRLLLPLVASSLGVRDRIGAREFLLPEDRVRVFVYAPLPEEFHVAGDGLGDEAGYVLYCVDLLKPGEP